MSEQHHVIQGVDMQHYNAFDEWLASTALGRANQSYIEEIIRKLFRKIHHQSMKVGVPHLMHCQNNRSRATTFTSA